MTKIQVRPEPMFYGEAGSDTDWHRDTAALVEYWASKCQLPLLPRCEDIDPLDIPRLLPCVWMCDVEPQPFRLKYRLLGTRVVEFIERDATGEYVDDVFPNFETSDLKAEALAIFESGRSSLYAGPPLIASDPEIYMVERATLPLASDGQSIDLLLGITVPRYRDG